MIEKELGEILTGKNLKIAVAESCSGGLIGHRITNVPGASRYFLGDVVAYDNEVKINLLGVPREVIIKHGAVSEECARYMAEGVRKLLGADVSVATTGIAGPTGGTKEKPVGLVYMAVSYKTVEVRKYLFKGSRLEIKNQTAENAMKFVVEVLSDECCEQ